MLVSAIQQPESVIIIYNPSLLSPHPTPLGHYRVPGWTLALDSVSFTFLYGASPSVESRQSIVLESRIPARKLRKGSSHPHMQKVGISTLTSEGHFEALIRNTVARGSGK